MDFLKLVEVKYNKRILNGLLKKGCSQGSKHFLRTRLRNLVHSGIVLILQEGKRTWLFRNIKNLMMNTQRLISKRIQKDSYKGCWMKEMKRELLIF